MKIIGSISFAFILFVMFAGSLCRYSLSWKMFSISNSRQQLVLMSYRTSGSTGSSKSKSFDKVPLQRIERILSNRGLGTRKEVDAMLKRGRICTTDGKVLRNNAERFLVDTTFLVDHKPYEDIPKLIAYHKPVGIQSTYGDPWKRPNLNLLREKYPFFRALHPIGRLDADSCGLLLFSKDGSVTQHLLNPRKHIEREYDCLVLGKVEFRDLQDTLIKGVNTSEGVFPAILSYSQTFSTPVDLDYFHSLIDQRNKTMITMNPNYIPNKGKEENNGDDIEMKAILATNAISYLRVAVTEGKYRMVRRILHNAGHSVCFLRRRRYGEIYLHPDDPKDNDPHNRDTLEKLWPLKSHLTEESIRRLTAQEMNWVKSLTRS
jgi:pseudouridine synthase